MCDCLCALPAAGGVRHTIFAKNSDRPPGEAQVVEWHPPRREATTRTTYLDIDGHDGPTVGFVGSRPTWMWGVEHGVNEAGVAIGNEAVFTTTDPTSYADALVGMDLVRLGLERATTARAAVEVITSLLERHGQGGSGHEPGPNGERWPYWSSFLLADPTEAWVLDTDASEWSAEQITTRRAISNRLSIPTFADGRRDTSPTLAACVDPRWEASKALLADSALDVDTARAHLRSHVGGDSGWTVCMHVDGLEATTAALVAELPANGRPVARFLLGAPCRSVFVPVLVGHPLGTPPAWERFAALDDRHRAELDALETELDRGVTAAAARDDRTWNAAAWASVTAVLDQLDAPGPGLDAPRP